MKDSQVALMVLTSDAPCSAVKVVHSSRLPHDRAIIVSNGSSDKADAEMQRALPHATVVRVRPAKGITHCFNIALRLPVEAKWTVQPDWTILANDDVEFDRDWLPRFGEVVRANPKLLQVNMAYPRNRYSCFAVHRDLIRQIGWFDERFTGMFYEDDDWHLRLCELAKCPPGARVHEKDKDSIFTILPCVRHDDALRRQRAADRRHYDFRPSLSKAPNKEFFYKKWAVVEKGGWKGKGLPGLFVRRLPEIEWYPRALLGGAMK